MDISGFLRNIFLLFGILAFSPAKSALVVSLQPASPSAGEEIFAEITSTSGPQCFPPAGLVTIEDGVVTFKFIVTDACVDSDLVSQRQYSIGSLASGSYRFDLSFCVENPPPHPSPCTVLAQVPFVVGASPAAVSLPVDSRYLLVAMVGALGFLSLLFIHARRRI